MMVGGFRVSLFLYMQRAHGVEDGEDGDADIGEDRRPEPCPADCTEDKDDALDADGEGDVLPCDAHGLACNIDGGRDLSRLVGHEDDIRRLDCRVRAEYTHGDADIGACEDRGIVDAIADVGECSALLLRCETCLDLRDLVLREQLGMDGVDAEALADTRADWACVAREHNGLTDAALLQGADRLRRVLLDLVCDVDDACEAPVNGEVDRARVGDGRDVYRVLCCEEVMCTEQDEMPVDMRGDAAARVFLHRVYVRVLDCPAVACEGTEDGAADGME